MHLALLPTSISQGHGTLHTGQAVWKPHRVWLRPLGFEATAEIEKGTADHGLGDKWAKKAIADR